MKSLVVLALVVAACAKPNDLAALQREAAVIATANQPRLDALVDRVHALQHNFGGNLPGWENMWRTAELADDDLGLPAIAQTEPPGPGWKPNPTSLLGLGTYARAQAKLLADHNELEQLVFLVEDEQRRFVQGIASVDKHLTQVETFLAAGRDKQRP